MVVSVFYVQSVLSLTMAHSSSGRNIRPSLSMRGSSGELTERPKAIEALLSGHVNDMGAMDRWRRWLRLASREARIRANFVLVSLDPQASEQRLWNDPEAVESLPFDHVRRRLMFPDHGRKLLACCALDGEEGEIERSPWASLCPELTTRELKSSPGVVGSDSNSERVLEDRFHKEPLRAIRKGSEAERRAARDQEAADEAARIALLVEHTGALECRLRMLFGYFDPSGAGVITWEWFTAWARLEPAFLPLVHPSYRLWCGR